jgi:glyoxylase-like metal-dependent hydrolase (beta-lactamase superfamily II)
MADQFNRFQTRRELLKTALGAAGVVMAAPVLRLGQAAAQAPAPNSIKLADDLYILQLPGEENVIAQTDARGVLLVDGGSARGSDALMAAVAKLPNAGTVHTLFNTHWHPEQTGSNERLGKAGATIIAHENTRLWEQQNVTWPWGGTVKKLVKVAQPNKTFYDTGKLDSGVRYGYISDAAHTDGDIYVHFLNQNVLAVGGAVYGQGWADLDWWSGGWIGGMVGGLQRLQTVADANTRIIPAKGPALGLADLKTQLDMYGTIYDRLSQLLNRGRSPKEAVEAKVTKEWDEKLGNSDAFVTRAFESLWAYVTPDA